jgi:hypothetical protein
MSSHKHLTNVAKKYNITPAILVESKKSIGDRRWLWLKHVCHCCNSFGRWEDSSHSSQRISKTDFTDMINKIWDLKQQYGRVTNIYGDASAPVVWQALKRV